MSLRACVLWVAGSLIVVGIANPWGVLGGGEDPGMVVEEVPGRLKCVRLCWRNGEPLEWDSSRLVMLSREDAGGGSEGGVVADVSMSGGVVVGVSPKRVVATWLRYSASGLQSVTMQWVGSVGGREDGGSDETLLGVQEQMLLAMRGAAPGARGMFGVLRVPGGRRLLIVARGHGWVNLDVAHGATRGLAHDFDGMWEFLSEGARWSAGGDGVRVSTSYCVGKVGSMWVCMMKE